MIGDGVSDDQVVVFFPIILETVAGSIEHGSRKRRTPEDSDDSDVPAKGKRKKARHSSARGYDKDKKLQSAQEKKSKKSPKPSGDKPEKSVGAKPLTKAKKPPAPPLMRQNTKSDEFKLFGQPIILSGNRRSVPSK